MTTVTVDVDVDLEDFDTDDLIAELESRGEEISLPNGFCMPRIEHLVACGLIDQAKKEAWEMIEKVLEK